jgi:hypothetical protein
MEFIIILLFVSFATGAAMFVSLPSSGLLGIFRSALESALRLLPLAVVLTLFLAFFSFELRVQHRAAAWLGLFLLGSLLLGFGIGLRRVPLLREPQILSSAGLEGSGSAQFIPPETVLRNGRASLWVGSFEQGEALDAVAVDFGSDYPRLAYVPRVVIDPSTGEADIQGRMYRAVQVRPKPLALVPEASVFSGAWIWDRLSSMDREPLLVVFATAGGFLLLCLGFRFLCRITHWPLANALLAAAGLAALLVADAALSGRPVLETIASLSLRFGLPLQGPLLLAAIEGFLGLALGAVDLATASRGSRRLDA